MLQLGSCTSYEHYFHVIDVEDCGTIVSFELYNKTALLVVEWSDETKTNVLPADVTSISRSTPLMLGDKVCKYKNWLGTYNYVQ